MPEPKSALERLKEKALAKIEASKSSNAPSTTSSSSVSTPSSSTDSKPVVETNVWDSQLAPVIDRNKKWQPAFDTIANPDVLGLKYALNGEYKKFATSLNSENKKAYDKFETSANNFKDVLLKLDKGEKIPQQDIEKASLDWQTDFQTFKNNSLAPRENVDDRSPIFDDQSKKIISHVDYLKKSQDPVPDYKRMGTSVTVSFKENGNLNPDATYNKIKDWEKEYKNDIDKNIQPVLNSWIKTGLIGLNKKDNTAYQNNVYKLVTSALDVVSKYPSDEYGEGVKEMVFKLSGLLKNKSNDFDAQIEIIKQNDKDINVLFSNLNFFAKTKVFNDNKDAIGNDDIYYESDSELYNNLNAATSNLENYGVYRTEIAAYKTGIKTKAENTWNNKDLASQKSPLFNALINQYGDVVELDEFKKIIKSMPPVKIKETAGGETDEFGVAIGPQKSQFIREVPYANWLAGKEASMFNVFAQMGRESSVDNQLDDIYKNLSDQYIQTMDTSSPATIDTKYFAGLYAGGFGDLISPALVYKGVNLNQDNINKQLADVSNPKQENINKIYKLLVDSKGAINKSDIVLFNDADITKGLEAFDQEDLNINKVTNPDKFKEFFKLDPNDPKANENLDMVDVAFERYSNIPGHAYYEFEKPNGKKLGMIIPHKKLEDVSELMYVKTKENPIDRLFHFTGEYKMPNVTDNNDATVIKDRNIRLDGDKNNIISFSYLDDSGNWVDESFSAGHTSMTTIENTKAIMNSITNQIVNKKLNQ
jgi:hypothetical protein